jgi:hypothetical protein
VRIFSALLLTTILLSACFDKLYTIWIRNNSGEAIYFFESQTYPDTSLPILKPYVGGTLPNEEGDLNNSSFFFKEVDTLIIFILNPDTFNFYPWDSIRSKYKILKRYEVSELELERNNWRINYP